MARIAGGYIEISASQPGSVASGSTAVYKLPSSQIEGMTMRILTVPVETVAQAMLLSYLQAVCSARRASTVAQSPQAHSSGAKQPSSVISF